MSSYYAVILFLVEDVDIFIDEVIFLALNIAYKVISVSSTVSSYKASVALELVLQPIKS